MKSLRTHWRLAGILAVAALTPACVASHRASPRAAPAIACTTVPAGGASAAGPGGQQPQSDMPSVSGSLAGIAARSSSSAVAVGWTGPTGTPQSRALVAVGRRGLENAEQPDAASGE
jgi:hypothetical protein